MKKSKSKKRQMAFLLKNNLQWNIVQVAIDHMIEHLSEVLSEVKGSEKKNIKERLNEAYVLKETFAEKGKNVFQLKYRELLHICDGLKKKSTALKEIDMDIVAGEYQDLNRRLKQIDNKCSYSSLSIIY